MADKFPLIDTYRVLPNGTEKLHAVNDCFESPEQAVAVYQSAYKRAKFVARVREG